MSSTYDFHTTTNREPHYPRGEVKDRILRGNDITPRRNSIVGEPHYEAWELSTAVSHYMEQQRQRAPYAQTLSRVRSLVVWPFWADPRNLAASNIMRQLSTHVKNRTNIFVNLVGAVGIGAMAMQLGPNALRMYLLAQAVFTSVDALAEEGLLPRGIADYMVGRNLTDYDIIVRTR